MVKLFFGPSITPQLTACARAESLAAGDIKHAHAIKGISPPNCTKRDVLLIGSAEKAAGGEIVHVKREDDPAGKWNYEVVVKTSGKEWGFEVDPNGKFVKKHGEIKE